MNKLRLPQAKNASNKWRRADSGKRLKSLLALRRASVAGRAADQPAGQVGQVGGVLGLGGAPGFALDQPRRGGAWQQRAVGGIVAVAFPSRFHCVVFT